jgi:Uma2 family endonuclease
MAIPAVDLHIRHWTREEYERMAEQGFFRPGERVELVDGIIYEMTPQSTDHAVGVRLVRHVLGSIFSRGFDILVQMPLALSDDSAPEPDVAIVPGDPRDHLESHPASAVLVVEVAETSLSHDRKRKMGLYARAGIPEYWVLLTKRRRLEVFRDPGNGIYQSKTLLKATDRISPLARPEASILVADLLP